jgi:PKD repeat protein
MKRMMIWTLLLFAWMTSMTAMGQVLPGDSIVFGPMFSPVYHDSVRVWVVTKSNTGVGDAITLEVTGTAPGAPLEGTVYNSDDRLGYNLRSFVYPALVKGATYTAALKRNGTRAKGRTATIRNTAEQLSDFEFLTGGCGRIYDLRRCIDRPEAQTHVNGDPAMYNRMAAEGSDLMIWTGDATYLLGVQHAMGQCPDGIDDWANKDMAFARYAFYRSFHDSLTRAMPQLAITDNHDTGPNEFNKTLPTLGEMKEIFMDWWPNPHYGRTKEGQGLFSSYVYKDVEYFLLDNRSYRDGVEQHLGPEQLAWLKQALLSSKATFKVLINGTPSFAKHWGGRNFSVTQQATELIAYIQEKNIDGVLCFSADIHEEEFYGRYGDVKYPLFDMISGNLNSDIGNGQHTIDYTSDRILRGVKQTYLRVNVYGEANDRRMKIEYVNLQGQPYFTSVIHADMLKSVDADTRKLFLSFAGALKDSSTYDHTVQGTDISYGTDKNGVAGHALQFSGGSSLQLTHTGVLDLHDRPFTVGYWVNPSQFGANGSALISTGGNTGVTLGFDKDGYPQYTDLASKKQYTGTQKLLVNRWAHMLWQYDNVRHQLSLYYNGQLVQQWSNVDPSVASAAAWMLGNDTNNRHFIGLLDEVSVYGKLVSDNTVKDLADFVSTRGNVLKLGGSSTTTLPEEVIGAAMKGDFTLEFWGKLNADPGDNTKIVASNGRLPNNNTTGIGFEYPSSNKLNVTLGNNTGGWQTGLQDKGSAWNIGEWNHIALSYAGGKWTYYVNGEKAGEVTSPYTPNPKGMGIGHSPSYTGGGTQSELDEFRIWSRALPQDSIRKYMFHTLTGKEQGLEIYYDFSEATGTTVASKGNIAYTLPLVGTSLTAGTSPVAELTPAYRQSVTGYWSKGVLKSNAGFALTEPITSYTSNLVVGKQVDTGMLPTAKESQTYYLAGGWQLEPQNYPFGNFTIDLDESLPKADSIRRIAREYFWMQQDEKGAFSVVNEGSFDGRTVTFRNTVLEEGVYYLGWKADTTALFDRGGNVSFLGGHSAQIPFADINPVFAGEFTLELWARVRKAPAAGGNVPLVSNHGRINNNTSGMVIEYNSNKIVSASFGTNTADWNKIDTGTPLNLDEWNHLAVTVSPAGKTARMYVNGVLVGTKAFNTFATNTNWNFGISHSVNYKSEAVSMMDEVRVWNRVKTEAEIRAQMHLSVTDEDPSLIYNYTADQADKGYLINRGVKKDSIAYTKANIVDATSPVVNDIAPLYSHYITGNWSRQNTTTNGLYLKDAIKSPADNMVVGRDRNNGLATIGSDANNYYVKGGWLLNAQNIERATALIDLAAVFNRPDSVTALAKSFYLLQGDPEGKHEIVATGKRTGNLVEFTDLALDFGVYYLGYETDLDGIIDKQGGALDLAAGHNVSIPYADVNNALSGEFTIEVWAKLNADPAEYGKLIGFSSSRDSYFAGFEFEFRGNNALQTILGKGQSGGWNTISSTTPWNVGEWNHAAVTVTPNKYFRFYINGELIDSVATGTFQPNAYNMAFATNLFNNNESLVTIDEFRIWNKAKTQAEIRRQMHQTLPPGENNLVYHFSFDQATGQNIINTGSQGGTIPYTKASLVPATTPVGTFTAPYNEVVSASWSLKNADTNGLLLKDRVTDYYSNLVAGREANNQIIPVPNTTDTVYMKGGWQVRPLNLTRATVKIDLSKLVANPNTIAAKATKFLLFQGDMAVKPTIAAEGTFNGKEVEFASVTLQEEIYHLAWKVGTAAPVSAEYQVNTGNDDAEQDIASGKMYLTSSDIEFTKDAASDQLIGVRFNGINIPQGSVIEHAYLQFVVDEVNTTGQPNILIGIEDTDSPNEMSSFDFDIYHRIQFLGDTIVWQPGPFARVGDAGADQRTPDLAELLNEIVSRPNWKEGNSVLFTLIDPAARAIKGYTANTDKRVAQAYENNPANAPRLMVTYVIPDRYYNGTFPVAKSASWKYDDSGADLTSADWKSLDYNDAAWQYGNAILGYGDSNESTTLNFGSDAQNKRTTYYLRHIFEVKDRTEYDSLLFDVLRDDGAIVYVNGTEAFRTNMPEGPVAYNTFASATVNDADERAYNRYKTKNLLRNGTNVIAVELHQASASSSDLSFDLAVGFTEPPLPAATYPLVKESLWRYLDKGISLDAVAWKDTTYTDDRAWAIGQGALGYGDPVKTIISYGPDGGNKYITTYFRRDIMVDTSVIADEVEIGMRRDDGALVYINGVEVIRDNMPEGAINAQTFSSTIVDGAAETTYYTFRLPKTVFRNGRNQLAVEIHNRDGSSSDLGFDLYLKDAPSVNPPVQCTDNHIACFTSIHPTGQTTKMIIPEQHRFQLIFKQGTPFTKGSGTVPGNHDFTAYVPINGSSSLGHLSVNHENTPGGVSIVDLHLDKVNSLWVVDTTQAVDLYNSALVTTTRNCSGGITPWGTVITCEESLDGGDVNGDGYNDVGWAVEIDPVTSKVKDYDGDGKQDKLWALGRMNHENVVVHADGRTVYYGEDGGTHCVYKFVADVAGNLTAGTLYVLKLDQPLSNNDPTGSTAVWVKVPNATKDDRNNTISLASSLGGTNFDGVEDVEISPIDGKIYFTSKGKGRVYRFRDGGAVSEFETFVGGTSYSITTKEGVVTEAWGGGNDNLTFDDKGNLWVLQDGDNYYIWVVRPDHTQSNPKVELFASMPAGSEPTGLTFSPDFKYGFFSVQHPNGNNAAQPDATGNDVKFDASATVIFALNADLGAQPPVADFSADRVKIKTGESITFTDLSTHGAAAWAWTFEGGTPATSTEEAPVVTYATPGVYDVTLVATNATGVGAPVTKADYILVENEADPVTGLPEGPGNSHVLVFPNPSHGMITVRLSLAGGENLALELFDLMGRKLATLATGKGKRGEQTLTYNLHDVTAASQLVILKVKIDEGESQYKIQVLK